MDIERTKKEIIIRLSPNTNTDDLQNFIDYARYKELTSKFKVEQNQVDNLVNQIKLEKKANILNSSFENNC